MLYTPKVTKTKFKNPKRIPRIRVRCNPMCCKQKLDIYPEKMYSEIGGVLATNEFWKKLFNKILK